MLRLTKIKLIFTRIFRPIELVVGEGRYDDLAVVEATCKLVMVMKVMMLMVSIASIVDVVSGIVHLVVNSC